MPLSPLDRAFLADIATTNWMHHFVVVAALKRTGAEDAADPDALVLNTLVNRHNLDRNLSFWDRAPLEISGTLSAQLQSMVMLRVFQERIAAMEGLGALLVALSRRASHGVALSHWEHTPTQIARAFGRLLGPSPIRLYELISWPDPNALPHSIPQEVAERHRRLAPWLNDRAAEVAKAYLRPAGLSLGTLGHIENDYNPRGSVFVIICHESRWREGRELDPDLIVKAYNMVKHGFNATTVFNNYEAAAAAGRTAIVLEVPKSEQAVQQFGQEIDLVGVLCREIARMSLELDDAAAL
jgi:hypothetical protein